MVRAIDLTLRLAQDLIDMSAGRDLYFMPIIGRLIELLVIRSTEVLDVGDQGTAMHNVQQLQASADPKNRQPQFACFLRSFELRCVTRFVYLTHEMLFGRFSEAGWCNVRTASEDDGVHLLYAIGLGEEIDDLELMPCSFGSVPDGVDVILRLRVVARRVTQSDLQLH